MFSLIITIISIALVAALALATLYYGGAAFKRGAASADATKLYVQAQQLQGAAELYKADTGAYPLTMEAMLAGNYLKSIPVSSLNPGQTIEQRYGSAPALMAQASAAGVVWKMVLSGQPVFAMTQVSVAVCEAVNMKAYGISGVLKSARASYSTQCFGTDLNNLTMVTTKSGAALITASLSPLATVALGTVLTTAPPTVNSGDTTSAGWLTVEGVTVAAVVPPPTPPVTPPGNSPVFAGTQQPISAVNQFDTPYLSLFTSSQYGSSNVPLRISPGNFEPTVVGQVSAPKTITILPGDSNEPADMGLPFLFSDLAQGNEPDFIVLSHTCPSVANITTSCTVTVAFAPKAPGLRINAFSNSGSYGNNSGPAEVRGIGLSPGGELAVSVSNLPPTFIGTQSLPVFVEYANYSSTAVTVNPVVTSGSQFTSTSTCGTPVPAGYSCAVALVFTPTDTSSVTATVTAGAIVREITGTGIDAGPANPRITLVRGLASPVFSNVQYRANGSPAEGFYSTGNPEIKEGGQISCEIASTVPFRATCTVNNVPLGAATLVLPNYYDGALEIPVAVVAEFTPGMWPMFSLSDTTFNLFGPGVAPPGTSFNLFADLTNNGTTPITDLVLSVADDASNSPTTVVPTSNCSASLAPGATCRITIAVTRDASGDSFSKTLNIDSGIVRKTVEVSAQGYTPN